VSRMKYVHIDQIEQGQVLGKTIFSSNGNVLLSAGTQLTVYMISTLRRIGVSHIYIKDPHFDDIQIEDVISEETKRSVIKNMSESFEAIRSGKDFSTRNVSVTIDGLLDEVMRNKEVLVQLTDIRTEDNAKYVHALNVCLMSILIGINMNLNAIQLKELAIGALLHDIGKVGIKEEDGKDPKKHHTWRGFEILKNKREFSLLIAHVALQHHEAVDGSGIPRGLEGDKIHLYAKIIAAANTFDNMLYDLSEGRKLLPHEACEKLMTLAGRKLDQHVLVHFLKTISIYPTGSSVKLSNRETGVVVGQHRGLPGRPIVRVVTGGEGDGELEVKEIDLAKHTTLFVEVVLD
jgi:HD-GYP domain-containing protein (c-di-GMP phosphodiesterase class II)